MINALWITNPSGNTLTLNMRSSDREVGLLVFNIEGLGPPKASVNGSGGPNFDGVRVSSVRTDARQITITVVVTRGGIEEEQAKQLIYDYFPIKQTIAFRVVTDMKDVYTTAVVEQNEFNQFATVENAVISLYCPDPYFLDVLERTIAINSDSAIPLFEFPFENVGITGPTLEFGYLTDVPTGYIEYAGEVKTGIDINMVFNDYVNDVVITNTNRSQQMTLDFTGAEAYFGSAVAAGDQVFINTRVGQKSIHFIRSGVWFNMINGVGIDDDWIQLHPGNNTVVITAAVGEDYIDTEVIFRELREGV